jgi:serine protease Do
MQLNAAGSGSGFIIDESGIAVTNNHVVTGAALLKVYVGGEDTPRNAKILGVSECSDLAVIDIDGDGFPYLEWYEGDINVGLDVYAAGFPLGDPEFTLTRGIVSKAQAGGETSWASVDRVLEHDATINPGNSGGPLVDANGHVVGVNYAGASSTNQYFAIARDEALELIDVLRSGQDVTSIGVNGEAVNDGAGLSGIWVSSVKSGSVADNTGVEMGDIITQLEGLNLATDGTMADYCDILRTHNRDDVMDIQVVRYATEEVLEGQLSGRELELSFSFAQALDDEVADDGSGAAETYDSYATVSDDSGQLQVEIPTVWSDVNGNAWTENDANIGNAVSAAPNLDDFWGTWTTPGMFFGASSQLGVDDEQGLLDQFDYGDSCTYGGREAYVDALYTGYYDLWSDCGGTGSLYIVLSASPEDQSFIILVTVQVVTDADLDALDHILNSFVVLQ